MTQKELSYVEDATMHEDSIISICEDIIEKLTDEKLISFMENELETHQNIKQNLLDMLEVKVNG